MPGYGVSKQTHRISLKPFDGSDEWVDIRASRSGGAASRIAMAALAVTGIDPSGTPIISVREGTNPLFAMRQAQFEESIVAWSLKADEADSGMMPIDAETFENVLAGDVAEWLDGEITRYYQQRRTPAAALGESSGSS